MRKIGMKSSSSQETENKSAPKEGNKQWFKNNQRPILAMALIVLVAFFLRLYFAYGVSADNAFALSGGTSASEHLHTIVEIVTGGAFFGTDGALYYPFGSANVNPPLMDLILAAFAMIGNACGMTAVAASEAVLSWSAVIFGTLACIPMYYLGKEMLGSKTAGYLSALFLALCPVVITQTVFSNGTEIAFIAFMFILMAYFMVKGVKLLNNDTAIGDKIGSVSAANKQALKYALISGLILAIIAYSWNGFRSIVVVVIFAMAIMVLVDRFRAKDARAAALFFSIIILIGVVLAAPYYIVAGLWDLVFSGVFIASLISVAVFMLFSMTQKTAWTLTIPVFAIVLIVAFVALYFVAPSYYTAIVAGNSVYVGVYSTLISTSALSLSAIATNFGFLTMWFGLIMVGYMLFKLPKNLSSPLYLFTIMWMIVCMYFGVMSTVGAAIFAPAFAIGFAAVIVWLFKTVNFKEYFASFRGSDVKTFFRKLIKPVPFASLLVVLFLICAPNAMYAIDGSISTNDSSKYNDQLDDVLQREYIGALGYTVNTSTEWLSDYSDMNKDGSLVTWMGYADDAATFGNFDVIVDSRGNGTSAMANILLSNGSNGASTAATLLYLISYYGIDNCKSALTSAGLSETDFTELKNIINNPSDYRTMVIEDPAKYGVLMTSVSDENVSYIYGKMFLADNYSTYQISAMYDSVSEACNKDIGYILVSGDMFPMYYGYSTTFATLAYLNGYALSDSYGTVSEFLTVDTVTQYYGIYSFTESMYNTLLWRAYIGMSPSEAGLTSTYSSITYLEGLARSDGTYKATPGFGLSNYEVDYDNWYVMYNEAATSDEIDSDKWVKMLYTEAIALQESSGGFINYLSGLPVLLKYVSNDSGTSASGTVVSYNNVPVSGVRVAVIDSEGIQRSTTFTDEEGKYTVLIMDNESKITFSAGVDTMTGGSLIATIDYAGGTTIPTVTIAQTILSGKLVTSNETIDNLTIKMTGSTTGMVYSPDVTASKTFLAVIVPDTYTIEVYSGKTLFATTSYLTAIGTNSGLEISLDSATLTVTVNSDTGVIMPGVEVVLSDTTSSAVFSGITDSDGKVEIELTPGTYVYSIDNTGSANKYTTSASPITLEADDDESATVKALAATEVAVPAELNGQMALIYNSSYTSAVKITGETIYVPTGSADNAVFSIYVVKPNADGTKSTYLATTVTAGEISTGYKVTGDLMVSDDPVAGTIVFMGATDYNVKVPVNAVIPETDEDDGYEIYLPTGTYTIYATDNSAYVYIGSLTVGTEDVAQDIVMESARKISGNTYWYSSTYKLEYVPLAVSGITDVDQVLGFLSDADGAYSFFIPSGSGCTVTASVAEDSGYYYLENETKVYQIAKTIESGTSSSSDNNFTASAEDVTVRNGSSDYAMKVGGTEIAAGETATIAITSTSLSVVVDGTYTTDVGTYYYYYSGTKSVSPGPGEIVMTVDAVQYDVFALTVENETDVVTITAVDEGVQKTKTGTGVDREYYLQTGESFLVTVKDADATKVWYYNYTAAVEDPVVSTLVESVTVTGFVGLAAAGTITIDATPETAMPEVTFTVSSAGKYTVVLPKADSYTFAVEVTNTVDEVDYLYSGVRVVDGSTLTEEENIVNMAVTGGTSLVSLRDEMVLGDEAEGSISAVLTINNMTEITSTTTKADIDFTAVITATGDYNITHLLTGGTSWSSVLFYSDAAMTRQITSITGSGIVYGSGTVTVSTAAVGSADLSVILTDINGNEACKGLFDKNDANWSKTTPTAETTKVNYGTDVVNDTEYRYAVSLVNNDNYTKSYTITSVAAPSGWYATFVYNNEILAWTASGITVDVEGYSTLEVYLKVTSMNGKSQDMPSEITQTVTAIGVSEITTDEEIGITVSGNTATVISQSSESSVKVDSLSASGRGVFNDKGSMPSYIWILFAVMILLFILTMWLGMRRGVFARKK